MLKEPLQPRTPKGGEYDLEILAFGFALLVLVMAFNNLPQLIAAL